MSRIRIAIQKSGRLSKPSLALLEKCGIQFSYSRDKLFWFGKNFPLDLLLVRDDDIPRLLMDGVCDLGMVGENVMAEISLSRPDQGESPPPKKLLPLGFGNCRLSLAGPEDLDWQHISQLDGKRIATSYPQLASRLLADAGLEVRIIELAGSVEIAPSMGTADGIVDLVSTGTTLRANHLKEYKALMHSEACLYQGASEPAKEQEATMELLLQRLHGVLHARESKYVMLHAHRDAIDRITELLPGSEHPTLMQLEGDPERVALHAVCRETLFWEHLEALKLAGATAVLVLPIEKMLA